MPNVKNTDDVKQVLYALEEHNSDLMYDIVYESKDTIFADEDHAGMPAGWTLDIHDTNTKRQYDSYGNGYTSDAYVILRVQDGSEEELYLLPVSYASFEGWSISISDLEKTKEQEKVITFWGRRD